MQEIFESKLNNFSKSLPACEKYTDSATVVKDLSS